MRVLILGGTGFIGRHAAAALRARGHAVVIGTRQPKRALAKLPPALRDLDLRETHLESLTTRYVWKPLLADVDVVLNAAGLLRERGSETFERVHYMAPEALAFACERLGKRLVHLSILGLRRESRNPFLRYRLAAERAIADTRADYSIVRPSLAAGEGRLARLPVHPCPTNAAGRIAALDVRDLAEALAVLCEARGRDDLREVELGGSARRTLAEHLSALHAAQPRDHAHAPVRLPLPGVLVHAAAAVCDLLHLTPLSTGPLELLRRDLCPVRNALPGLLGRHPKPVGIDLPARSYGYAFAAMPTGQDTTVPPSPR